MDSTTPKSPRMHPMLWIASGAVTLFSLAGIAALTGVLPVAHTATAIDAPATAAPTSSTTQPQQPVAPIAATSEPVRAEPLATPSDDRTVAAPVEHKHSTKPAGHTMRTIPEHKVASSDEPRERSNSAIPTRAPDNVQRPTPVARCEECGVVEGVRLVEQEGEGTGLGAVGGAILGGVLGHQVGEGTGKQIARIGGAILGGFAGNQAEKQIRKTHHYEVSVLMEDGSRRTVTTANGNTWHAGDKVRIEQGELVSRTSSNTGAAML